MAPTVILDLGAGTTKMAIVDYGIIRLSHTISKGSQDVTLTISRALGVDFAKAEEIKRKVGLVERLAGGQDIAATVSNIVEYIFLEANKAITVFQEKQRRAISKIVLIGGGALLKGLLPLAGRSFEVPVVLGQPFAKVEAPAFLADILNEAGSNFAIATGLALRRLGDLE
jgi:cell division ATPase FtsA